MKYFRKRALFFILPIALTTAMISYANETYAPPSDTYQTQNIIHSENNYTQKISPYENLYNTQPNSDEDEFASLYETNSQKESSENIIYEAQSFNNSTENTQNNIYETNTITSSQKNAKETSNNTYEILLLALSILLIITCSIFFYIKAKNRLTEIAGENFEIETDKEIEKDTKKGNKKLKKIKETVNALDKIYSKTAVRTAYKPAIPQKEIKKIKEKTDETQNLKIVNLDEILNRKQQNENIEVENQALEDFLSGFSYYEEEDFVQTKNSFNEEFYNEIIHNNKISFQRKDIECINNLLRLEINDEIFNNPNEFFVTNTIKKIQKEHILESLILDYAINKNITFTEEDFIAINKIMNVELDQDFVTDLRVNPEATKRMQKELEDFDKETKKPSKIKTLKVKDLLPDLSEALIKQGGRRIESNYRPETIYYQQGYDVSVMSVSDYLPNLSEEINKNTSSEKKVTQEYNLLNDNFEVATIHASNSLPDLSKEINTPPKTINTNTNTNNQEADPKKLLKNLNNVKFKNIDEKRNFEIINKDLQPSTNKNESITETISRKIAEIKTEKNIVEDKKLASKLKNLDNTNSTENITENSRCIVGNEAFLIIQSVALKDNIGCYLAKNDNGYYLLSHVGDKVEHLKHFKELKIEKLQSRLTEKLDDNKLRFIIRVGLNNKILVEVDNNTINYVMDL